MIFDGIQELYFIGAKIRIGFPVWTNKKMTNRAKDGEYVLADDTIITIQNRIVVKIQPKHIA